MTHKPPIYNEKCENCGSQLFTPIDSYERQDKEGGWVNGNIRKDRVGHKCVECDLVVLTREIPKQHANNTDLEMPDAADRDMVRED